MRKEIMIIWKKALELGFKFNETDAHEMWIAIKEFQNKENKDNGIKKWLAENGYTNNLVDHRGNNGENYSVKLEIVIKEYLEKCNVTT